MKTKLIFVTLFLVRIFLTSCSNHLLGTWSVQKYETTKPGQPTVSFKNIGTMTFLRHGQGEKNINYSLSGTNKEDKAVFTWKITDKYVKIESKDSDLSKTWILIDNNKSTQKWQTTDGSNQNVILEMKK